MPVDAIRLQNFMAFADTDWIKLRKINLLLGRNSSGKSAIIRALRLMKQSLLTNEGNQPLTFIAEGGVDIGSFNEAIHKPATENKREDNQQQKSLNDMEETRWSDPITFSFRGSFANESAITSEPLLWATWVKHLGLPEETRADNLIFEASVSYKQDLWSKEVFTWRVETTARNRTSPEGEVLIWGFEIIDGDFDQFYPYIFSPALSDDLAALNEYLEISSFSEFLPDFKPLHNSDESTIDWPDQVEAIASFWKACTAEISNFLESIVYVGPIRPLPKRTYTITDVIGRNWLTGGWQPFLSYLLQADDVRDQKINRWLQILKLGHSLSRDIRVGNISGEILGVVQLNLEETGRGDIRNLNDVGFGASQILPIIVQCVSAAPDALVLIEQPELHLHPEAQADVANLFIKSVNEAMAPKSPLHPRQMKKRRGVSPKSAEADAVSRRYLIETHSETMFLRFRVEIARTGATKPTDFPLDPNDFTCYYIERFHNEGVSEVGVMLFDSKGEFSERPERFFDFFGQDFKETMELRKARS